MRDKFEVHIVTSEYVPDAARISITTNGYQFSSTSELDRDELMAVCESLKEYLDGLGDE